MSTNQFQSEYIEYLQNRNTELLYRLNNMKENYENQILSKTVKKKYVLPALEDLLNLCTLIPQEIDIFFDKMTAAINEFQNILLRKSEMKQLVEKISKTLNSDNFNEDLYENTTSVLKDEISPSKICKKGPVKVSPMINGHIISTEPRICLSRVPGVFQSDRSIPHQLSPIIEASPDISSNSSTLDCGILREISVPLKKINQNKLSFKYIDEDSPKSRFKGPKTWKKCLSSNPLQSDIAKTSVFLNNNESQTKKPSLEGVVQLKISEKNDPLEGPSWLYEGSPEKNSPSTRFVDFKRRKHRFATVFDKNEECITSFEEKPKKSLKKNSNEFLKSNEEGDDEEENFEEDAKRISEYSEDFIFESCTSELDEKDSPSRKKSKRKKGKCIIESPDNGSSPTLNKSVKIHSNSFSQNERRNSNQSMQDSSDSSESSDNTEVELTGNKDLHKRKECFRQFPVKSSLEKVSLELSFENTSKTFDYDEVLPEKIVKSKNKKIKSNVMSEAMKNQVVIELEDCMANKRNSSGNSERKRLSKKKKYRKSTPKSKPQSPIDSYGGIGRKKRKAAPSFKLVEPRLNSKLRRT